MKPSAFRIERLLAKVEAEVARRGLRARRYAFHPDEVADRGRSARLALRACTQGFEQAGMAGAVWCGSAARSTTTERPSATRRS